MKNADPKVKELMEAFGPLRRVFAINEPLPIADGSPLSRCIPGIWPTWGEFKRVVRAVKAFETE